MSSPNVSLYISMSLDGYIATKEDDLAWLSMVEQEGEDYGYFKHVESMRYYIIGRKTYETVLKLTGGEFAQSETMECYVLTRQNLESPSGVTYYNGDITELVSRLKSEGKGNIYLDGGGETVSLFLKNDLIDTFIISVIPIILGDGKRLFPGINPTQKLKAMGVKKFDSGLIQLHYTRLTEA